MLAQSSWAEEKWGGGGRGGAGGVGEGAERVECVGFPGGYVLI